MLRKCLFLLAEAVRFELTNGCPLPVFKTSNKYRNINRLRRFCLRIIAEFQPKKAIIRADANAGCGDDLQSDDGVHGVLGPNVGSGPDPVRGDVRASAGSAASRMLAHHAGRNLGGCCKEGCTKLSRPSQPKENSEAVGVKRATVRSSRGAAPENELRQSPSDYGIVCRSTNKGHLTSAYCVRPIPSPSPRPARFLPPELDRRDLPGWPHLLQRGQWCR